MLKKFTLNRIVIYPVKGTAGITIPGSEVLTRGLKWDRRWMLIDEDNRFLSQRECPEMSLIKSSFGLSGLQVAFGKSAIELPYASGSAERALADIWGTEVNCALPGKAWDDYFSDMLSRKVRLAYLDDITSRVKKLKIPPYETSVSFADGYPFLVLGTESVALLNAKLARAVSYDRFRANFLVNTETPHEEDTWKRFRIGKVDFQMIKPCVRCKVITVDQATGKLSREPLKTLAGYRKNENGVIFAMNAIALNEGEIHINDPLEVLE